MTGDVTFEYTVDLSSGYSQVLKATNGTDTVYYTRGFELISRRLGEATSYYLFDGSLSVRALTDETGAITDTLVFDAFGNETEKTGTTANSYGFQGEEQDATGLYYLRARYMDPASGTFTSMDTYAGSLSDPMSLHKYLFANSNPIMYSDPSGYYTLTEQETTIAIQAILGEIMSGALYIVDWFKTDPESKNHSIGKMIIAMMLGLAQSAVMGSWGSLLNGLITKAGLSVLDYILTGIMFALFSGNLKLLAINLRDSGNWKTAVICDAGGNFAGLVAFCTFSEGFTRGWEWLKENTKNWKPNKKGFIRIGGSNGAENSNKHKDLYKVFRDLLNRDTYRKYDIDCSEIAEDFMKASGGKGMILHIESKSGLINVDTYGVSTEYYYHEVYSYNGYVYDPRYSNLPVTNSDYFNMIKALNEGGFNVWTIK